MVNVGVSYGVWDDFLDRVGVVMGGLGPQPWAYFYLSDKGVYLNFASLHLTSFIFT